MLHDPDSIPAMLKPAVRALQAGKGQVAAQCLTGATLDKHLPEGRPLAAWLTRKIGPRALRHLIEAFAKYPCFVCRGGYELCENCRGKGRNHATLCEPCLGFGVCNCKFCGGSGWVTINFVPPGLRFLTVIQRIRNARAQMAPIIAAQRKLARLFRRKDSAFLRKEQRSLIVRWNRLLTVFENAIVALRLHCGREPMHTRSRDQSIATCVLHGRRIDRHIRRLLGQLARSRQTPSRDATYYAEICEDPTFSSELEHPFLRRAMAASRPARTRSGSGKQRHARAPHKPSRLRETVAA